MSYHFSPAFEVAMWDEVGWAFPAGDSPTEQDMDDMADAALAYCGNPPVLSSIPVGHQ